jgi:hypothetical protein
MGAQGKIPNASGSTHNCFAKLAGISAGPYSDNEAAT